MPLETATYINQLDAANPLGSDPIAAGDDHLRLIKSTVKATFPNITGPVTMTQAQLNSIPDLVTNAGLAAALAGFSTTGRILQSVQTIFTSSVSTTSQSFVTTNHAVTITPSSTSSKILLLQSGNLFQTDEFQPSNNGLLTIYRGFTNLAGGTSFFAQASSGYANSIYAPVSMSFLDSPNTTSAVTYTIFLRGAGPQPNAVYSGVATFIALEIL